MRLFRTARRLPVASLLVPSLLVAAALAGCGGGGGGGNAGAPPPPAVTPTPTAPATPTPTPFPGATVTLIDIAGSQNIAAYAGYSGALSLSPQSADAALTISETTSLIAPVAVPTLPPDPASGVTPTVLTYITLTPSAALTLESQPTFSITLPTAPPTTATLESAFYDSADASAGWLVSTVPRQSPGSTQVTLYGSSIVVNLTSGAPYVGAVLELQKSGTSARTRRP